MANTYCIVGSKPECSMHIECWNEITEGLKALGYKKQSNVKNSDIILFRHCLMTSEEIKEALLELKDLSKKNPKGKVFLNECLSRTSELVETLKMSLTNLKIYQFTTAKEFFEALGQKYTKKEELHLLVDEDKGAIINITDGCKMKCTFCKLRYMDYEFVSFPFDEILAKVTLAKERGYRKVTLNAMNSTEYNYHGKTFQDLLKALLEIPDMLYQVNGIVMAELTDEALEVLTDKRFFCVQMELQSLIEDVREKMQVGKLSQEKILHIFDKMKGKYIVSNVMVGYCREHDKNFAEQLRIIEENNLFFLTVNNLVPTPGTKSSLMLNPSIDTANLRMAILAGVLTKLRRKIADSMIGKEQNGLVIHVFKDGSSMVLCDTGVLLHNTMGKFEVGQNVTVVPRSIKNFFDPHNQYLILSTENANPDMLKMVNAEEKLMLSMQDFIKMKNSSSNETIPNFNNNPISLKEYCKRCLNAAN